MRTLSLRETLREKLGQAPVFPYSEIFIQRGCLHVLPFYAVFVWCIAVGDYDDVSHIARPLTQFNSLLCLYSGRTQRGESLSQ